MSLLPLVLQEGNGDNAPEPWLLQCYRRVLTNTVQKLRQRQADEDDRCMEDTVMAEQNLDVQISRALEQHRNEQKRKRSKDGSLDEGREEPGIPTASDDNTEVTEGDVSDAFLDDLKRVELQAKEKLQRRLADAFPLSASLPDSERAMFLTDLQGHWRQQLANLISSREKMAEEGEQLSSSSTPGRLHSSSSWRFASRGAFLHESDLCTSGGLPESVLALLDAIRPKTTNGTLNNPDSDPVGAAEEEVLSSSSAVAVSSRASVASSSSSAVFVPSESAGGVTKSERDEDGESLLADDDDDDEQTQEQLDEKKKKKKMAVAKMSSNGGVVSQATVQRFSLPPVNQAWLQQFTTRECCDVVLRCLESTSTPAAATSGGTDDGNAAGYDSNDVHRRVLMPRIQHSMSEIDRKAERQRQKQLSSSEAVATTTTTQHGNDQPAPQQAASSTLRRRVTFAPDVTGGIPKNDGAAPETEKEDETLVDNYECPCIVNLGPMTTRLASKKDAQQEAAPDAAPGPGGVGASNPPSATSGWWSPLFDVVAAVPTSAASSAAAPASDKMNANDSNKHDAHGDDDDFFSLAFVEDRDADGGGAHNFPVPNRDGGARGAVEPTMQALQVDGVLTDLHPSVVSSVLNVDSFWSQAQHVRPTRTTRIASTVGGFGGGADESTATTGSGDASCVSSPKREAAGLAKTAILYCTTNEAHDIARYFATQHQRQEAAVVGASSSAGDGVATTRRKKHRGEKRRNPGEFFHEFKEYTTGGDGLASASSGSSSVSSVVVPLPSRFYNGVLYVDGEGEIGAATVQLAQPQLDVYSPSTTVASPVVASSSSTLQSVSASMPAATHVAQDPPQPSSKEASSSSTVMPTRKRGRAPTKKKGGRRTEY